MIEKAGGIDRYRSEIRYQVRGLWSGALDQAQFERSMMVLVNDGLAAAFAEGAAVFGITEEDFTAREQRAINDAADKETDHIEAFADSIVAANKASGGKLDPLLTRAEMWVLRYVDMVNLGKVMAGEDQKLEWIMGDTEHCNTCLSLSGIVHRGSQWRNYVLPQDHDLLCCHGYRCQCHLEPTKKRASRKYPPLPGKCDDEHRQ